MNTAERLGDGLVELVGEIGDNNWDIISLRYCSASEGRGVEVHVGNEFFDKEIRLVGVGVYITKRDASKYDEEHSVITKSGAKIYCLVDSSEV